MSGLTSGDVAREYGVTLRQLHHWREIGVIVPSEETGGGHSRYTEADCRKIRLARALRRGGLGWGRIRKVLPEVFLEVDAILAERLSV